jgi:dTDP-4-amino-4,6-dideoxygalactose transaminase
MYTIVYEDLKESHESLEQELTQAFHTVLSRGRFILGEEVALLEEEFARYLNKRFCIGTSSGTDALFLALAALDLPSQSEVLVAANCHISDVLAILQNGLTPVLVDPDPFTYTFTLSSIQKKMTDKTSAILAVHLYGHLCPMHEILPFAKTNGIKVVEDCAQAHGSSLLNQKAGSFGDVSAFSFYPTKNLGALGDGGMIATDDESIQKKLRLLTNLGSELKNHHLIIGYNKRLDELQAAFLRIKLKYLPALLAHKKKLAHLYLASLKTVQLPQITPGFENSWHIFPIRHEKRDDLQKYLKNLGIETLIHYPVSPYKQKALSHLFPQPHFPITDAIDATILSLPCSLIHTEEELDHICHLINRFA